MQEKQIRMVRQLANSSRLIPGKELAESLGVSVRTVINYINDINSMYPQPVILSRPGGYVINRQDASGMLQQISTIPDGYRERAVYLCKRLLLDHGNSVNVFDLCQELYISYSLLKSDLRKMNQSYAYLNVRFYTRNNDVLIDGSERDKRKLMNHIIQQENSDLPNLSTLKKYFSQETVDGVLSLLERAYQDNGFYLNDFAKMNLMLHMLTLISRITSGNDMKQEESEGGARSELLAKSEGSLAHQVKEGVEKICKVQIGPADAMQIYFLIKVNSTPNESYIEEDLTSFIGTDLLKQIQQIIISAEKTYCVRLNSNEFLVRFALHVKNLILRSASGQMVTNPLKASLRTSSPFLYDIAIFMVNQLLYRELIDEYPTEDEISFVVLHIGAEIERQNVTESTVKCALIVPDYLDVGKSLTQKLLQRFGDEITITHTLVLTDDLSQLHQDMIISTVDRTFGGHQVSVHISPFLTRQDHDAIQNAIERIQIQKGLTYLAQNFEFYFSPENFLFQSTGSNREKTIRILCDTMHKNGYVGEQYWRKVLEREQAVSTGYTGFAIPHSVSFEASSNGICVAIAPNGIDWAGKQVYVVFLMAISPDSLNDFQELYGVLAQILSNNNVIQQIRGCKTFEEFQSIMLDPNLLL